MIESCFDIWCYLRKYWTLKALSCEANVFRIFLSLMDRQQQCHYKVGTTPTKSLPYPRGQGHVWRHGLHLIPCALCSRNFQNVKLRQHGMEILKFACHADFTWNQILVNSNCQKCHLWHLEVLNLNFSKFEPFLKSQIYQNSHWEFLKL